MLWPSHLDGKERASGYRGSIEYSRSPSVVGTPRTAKMRALLVPTWRRDSRPQQLATQNNLDSLAQKSPTALGESDARGPSHRSGEGGRSTAKHCSTSHGVDKKAAVISGIKGPHWRESCLPKHRLRFVAPRANSLQAYCIPRRSRKTPQQDRPLPVAAKGPKQKNPWLRMTLSA